jgi:hypothetical protein
MCCIQHSCRGREVIHGGAGRRSAIRCIASNLGHQNSIRWSNCAEDSLYEHVLVKAGTREYGVCSRGVTIEVTHSSQHSRINRGLGGWALETENI